MNNQYDKITGRQELTDTTFVLETERRGMVFGTGQHLLPEQKGIAHDLLHAEVYF